MATEIIIKPIVTEKITALGDKLNRYGFIVDKHANKIEIKNAIEKIMVLLWLQLIQLHMQAR